MARWAANRLQSLELPGLIASVRGEPDIHPDVGSLPHEAAPLLDQMRCHGAPVKIDGPPLTPKQRKRLQEIIGVFLYYGTLIKVLLNMKDNLDLKVNQSFHFIQDWTKTC